MEYAGLALALAAIIYLSARKYSFSRTMFVAALIVALTSRMPIDEMFSTAWSALVDRATLELAGTVLAIGVFSSITGHLGFLEGMSSNLEEALNPKAVTALVPALIGLMPVLGGAQVSAPLVDKTGASLGLDAATRAAANLVFRHVIFFVFPFSPSLILLSNITGFPIGRFISRLWPAFVSMAAVAYAVLLKDRRLGGDDPAGNASVNSLETHLVPCSSSVGQTVSPVRRIRAFRSFLFYGSPLILALGISLLLHWPLWAGLSLGAVTACSLGAWRRRPLPSLQIVLKNPTMSQVPAMFWMMVFRAFITRSSAFAAFAGAIGGSGVRLGLFALLVPFALGFISANHSTALGVLAPVFVSALGAAPDSVKLSALSAVYISSFLAYLTSPLHLCQILTCRYFGISEVHVYRRYWKPLLGPMALTLLYVIHVARAL